jgi:hypothetical protein
VRNHAALLGQSLRSTLLLETGYADMGLSLVCRQDTVSWKPASTPWQYMHFDKLSYVLASEFVLWALDTEYVSLPQASVCVVSIAIRDYLTEDVILATTIDYGDTTLDELLDQVHQQFAVCGSVVPT